MPSLSKIWRTVSVFIWFNLSTAFHPVATPSLNCLFLWLWHSVFIHTYCVLLLCLLCPAPHPLVPQGPVSPSASSFLSFPPCPPFHSISSHFRHFFPWIISSMTLSVINYLHCAVDSKIKIFSLCLSCKHQTWLSEHLLFASRACPLLNKKTLFHITTVPPGL